MEVQDTTALNDSGVNQEVGGLAITDSPKFDPDSVNAFHDLDEVDASSAADDKKPGDKKDDEVAPVKDAKDDDERFDKHPRFQQLMKERDEMRLALARAEGRLEAAPPKEPDPVVLPYKDINALTDEQIREWQEDDPKGFAANLKEQVRHEAKKELDAEASTRQAREREQGELKRVYDDFAVKHKDFNAKWESGEILKYIEKNPGHNPMSAYLEMTADQKLADAVAEAKKATEEEVTKKFLAKRKATVLNGSPASIPRTEDDPALQNTKQHGGLTAVLADKLVQMRRQAGR